MNIPMIYITRKTAIESGLTHEGTLFGVPAWFSGDDEEIVGAVPKFIPFTIWTLFADFMFDAVALLMPRHIQLNSPITITGKITQENGNERRKEQEREDVR